MYIERTLIISANRKEDIAKCPATQRSTWTSQTLRFAPGLVAGELIVYVLANVNV